MAKTEAHCAQVADAGAAAKARSESAMPKV
jgi:hypothetical protein